MERKKPLMTVFLSALLLLAVIASTLGQGEVKTPTLFYDNDFLVGASYMTFLGTKMKENWSSGAVYWPTLGNYSSNNNMVVGNHTAWAFDSGIDFFFLDFGWGNDEEMRLAHESFLDSDPMTKFKFCIFYFPDNAQIAINKSRIVNGTKIKAHFSLLNERFLARARDNCLLLEDRSVVILADFPEYFERNSTEEINRLFSYLRGEYDLYLIPAFWPDAPDLMYDVLKDNVRNDSTKIYDAITLWGSDTIVEINETISYSEYHNKMKHNFENWSEYALGLDVGFVPLICPGYNNMIYAYKPWDLHNKSSWWGIVTRDPEGFQEVCKLAKAYSSPPHNLILLFTWNDFKEATSIEPTYDYGLTYLNIVAKEFLPLGPRYLIIASEAFGSSCLRPGDPIWNPIADIVEDGVIDIFDVVFIAKNSGKTIQD